MTPKFETIHNYYQDVVCDEVMRVAHRYPALADDADLLADVACVALNTLPARYIRHAIDLSFYLTEHERERSELAVRAAISQAFEFVQARVERQR